MLHALHQTYFPNKVVLLRPEADDAPIVTIASFTKAQKSLNGKATAYVCQNYACKLPTTDVQEMLSQLTEK